LTSYLTGTGYLFARQRQICDIVKLKYRDPTHPTPPADGRSRFLGRLCELDAPAGLYNIGGANIVMFKTYPPGLANAKLKQAD
jgi:hypothetical protein